MKIGYARCSTAGQDVAGQVAWLGKLGVDDAQVYTDHGYTGRNRKRPALARALEVCRSGDEFVVTKLDRLGRSARDLHEIVDGLVECNVALNIDGKVYDPADPMGKMFIGFLAIMAEFESDLNRQRTRSGVEVAKAKGKMRGKQHRLSPLRRNLLLRDHETGRFTVDTCARATTSSGRPCTRTSSSLVWNAQQRSRIRRTNCRLEPLLFVRHDYSPSQRGSKSGMSASNSARYPSSTQPALL